MQKSLINSKWFLNHEGYNLITSRSPRNVYSRDFTRSLLLFVLVFVSSFCCEWHGDEYCCGIAVCGNNRVRQNSVKTSKNSDEIFLWLADPCYNVFCTKGRMCVINSDFSTTCVCPEACPDDYSPVCSVYLRQFNSTCKLHKFACRLEIMMGIERKGECHLKGLVFSIMHGS